MNKKEPEKLNDSTPQWFKDWHDKTFWHFKYRMESKMDLHDKMLWVVLAAIVAGVVANIFFG